MNKLFSFLLLVVGYVAFSTQTLQARHSHHGGHHHHYSWWNGGYNYYNDPFWWTYSSILNATQQPRQKVIIIKENPANDQDNTDYEYIEEILEN